MHCDQCTLNNMRMALGNGNGQYMSYPPLMVRQNGPSGVSKLELYWPGDTVPAAKVEMYVCSNCANTKFKRSY